MNTGCSIALLESALAGNLPADDEAALNQHLDECEKCGATLERMAGGAAWCREAAAALLARDELDAALATRDEWSAVDFAVEHLEPTDEPNALGRLGGYDVLEVIGHGGMGVVLKAFDRELKRYVAIKVLAPHLAQSALAKKRFTREAQAAAAVVHPHVLAIHQVQPNGRLPFLVMPLVAGESLAARLTAQGRLELKETLRVGMQAAAGLAAAHEQGLVHRDVKPANILLEKGVERAVLTDFGLARAADDVTLTLDGVKQIGTAALSEGQLIFRAGQPQIGPDGTSSVTIGQWTAKSGETTPIRVAVSPPRQSTTGTLPEEVEKAVKTISTCAEGDPRVAEAMASLLGLNPADVVGNLCKFLDSQEATVRRAAIYILWQVKFASIAPAVPRLLGLCAHQEDLTRGMAALALGGNRVPGSIGALEKMTSDDPSGYARRCAAIALGFLGDPAATGVLEKALKNPETLVRTNAQAALKMLRQAAAEKAPSQATFGPVIERTLGPGGQHNICLDLETGRLHDPPDPKEVNPLNLAELRAWAAKEGIDLLFKEFLVGFDMAVFPMPNNRMWDNLPPADVLKVMEQATGATPAVITAGKELPVTVWFKTRKGTLGVLQFLGCTDLPPSGPRGVKIRYKLVQQPDQPRKTGDTSKDAQAPVAIAAQGGKVVVETSGSQLVADRIEFGQADGKTPPTTPGESRPSFDEARGAALQIIQSRAGWPQSPEALCKEFWAARARKDYEEMNVLWPGSASFDWETTCRKDDANVTYVFGAWDGRQVPYASADCRRRHGSYNMKMLLGSIETAKGKRYFIISGN